MPALITTKPSMSLVIPEPRRERLIIMMDIPKENVPLYEPGARLVITNNPPIYDIDDLVSAYFAFVHHRQTVASTYAGLALVTIEVEVHSDPRENTVDWATGVIPWSHSPEFTNTYIYNTTNPLPIYFSDYFRTSLPSYSIDIGKFIEEEAHDYWPLRDPSILEVSTSLIRRPIVICPEGTIERDAFSEMNSILAEDSKKETRVLARSIRKMISSVFH